MRTIPAMIAGIVKAMLNCSFIRCALIGFGASSVNYELLSQRALVDYAVFADTRMEVCLQIMERFAAEGIAFAYPTQTPIRRAPDGTLIMPWQEPQREEKRARG